MAQSFQVMLELASIEPLPQAQLEDLAEACLDTLNERMRMIAFGPVVSADFDRSVIEVEFTADAETIEDVHRTAETIGNLLVENARKVDRQFDFSKSQAERLLVAPA